MMFLCMLNLGKVRLQGDHKIMKGLKSSWGRVEAEKKRVRGREERRELMEA